MLTDDRATTSYREHLDNTFALAIAVLRERISGLPKEDRDDLYELIPVLVGDDEEERDRARVVVTEILDQAPARVSRMDLPVDPGSEMTNWIDFVSKRIREARENASMTQEDLAKKADLPQSHISRLETGKHSPSAKTLEKIAKALSVPLSTFDPCA